MAKKDKKKEELPENTFNLLGSKSQENEPSSGQKSGNLFGFTAMPQFGGSKKIGSEQSKTQVGSAPKHDYFSKGEGSKIISTGNRTWKEILADVNHWTRFPFSIGMEMELIISNDKGEYIEGEEATYRMGEIVKEAKSIMDKIVNYEFQDDAFPPIPQYIRNKLANMPFTAKDEEKGLTMNINYTNELTKQPVEIQVFGRDGNITSTTYILELVTPICVYAEELAYWAATLFQLAKKTLPKDMRIIATALNPTVKEYTRGLSHGDHNHIGGFQNDMERAQCYNMLRTFIPHIIGLSTNSPLINNAPTDVIKSKPDPVSGKLRYTAPNCIRSLRLKNNTTMLSGNDPKRYIPYLNNFDDQNKRYFLQTVNKTDWYDARYQDVFPMTDFGTIEVRVMDAQLSICRRIGLAMLNQALCYKARKLMQQGKWVPNVNSETLCFNRKGAIERGLVSIWKDINIDRNYLAKFDPIFADYYFGPVDNPHKFLFQAVQGMFHYLKDVLKELGFLYSPFLKPLLQSVFGTITYAEVPMTEADYQLSLYDYKMQHGEDPNIIHDLMYFTLEYSKDPINQPLTGDLTLPTSMTK